MYKKDKCVFFLSHQKPEKPISEKRTNSEVQNSFIGELIGKRIGSLIFVLKLKPNQR